MPIAGLGPQVLVVKFQYNSAPSQVSCVCGVAVGEGDGEGEGDGVGVQVVVGNDKLFLPTAQTSHVVGPSCPPNAFKLPFGGKVMADDPCVQVVQSSSPKV